MTLQILTNRDFQLFVLMNFFQVREKDLGTATEWGHRMWFVLLMGTAVCTTADHYIYISYPLHFFQVFMVAFCNNFTMIFAEHLIPPNVLPSLAKSFMYGAGFICPQVTYHSSKHFILSGGSH